jgi:hypothetical protein
MEIIQYKQSPFQKIRLGNQSADGGYIICDIPNLKYSLLLGGGVADDISFEEEFINDYCPGVKAHCFDASVKGLPEEYSDVPIEFHKQFIGGKDTEEYTSLKSYLQSDQTGIFIKMDIEGAEYEWLDSLSDEDLSRIDQLVIEFHYPWGFSKCLESIQRLYKTFYLFHFHENNCSPLLEFESILVPLVFEFTLVNKRHCEGLEIKGNTDPVPHPLDRPNNAELRVHQYRDPPYTF